MATEDTTTFVLLHGGRHGGWCWSPVARRLRAAHYEVHTPTLTGLGDRAHLLSREIGLDTHVRDLVAACEFEDVRNAVLVAHSYGGMVVAGAMEHLADRIRCLVLLDAHIPRTGESMLDLIGAARAAELVGLANSRGEGWYIPPVGAAYYGVTDPEAAAWLEIRMTAQPLKTYRDPVGSTDRAWDHPSLFVECVPSALAPQTLARARERSAADPRFHYRVLETSHNAMVTDPEAVTALLLEATALPAPAHSSVGESRSSVSAGQLSA
ncbi:alpha/beta fold hydrolase [Frankia sp. R43]|uniref:alpha/beta fold hydrolase n=1 Tax=Frankia sp. R43 TaxID=269536 RepID=UPI0007C6677A|nr:alpha/beta hydrolase [Frankia sp. R43]